MNKSCKGIPDVSIHGDKEPGKSAQWKVTTVTFKKLGVGVAMVVVWVLLLLPIIFYQIPAENDVVS